VDCVWAVSHSAVHLLSLAVGPHGGSHSDTCHHSALNIPAGESLIRLQNKEFVGATTKAWDVFQFWQHGNEKDCSVLLYKSIQDLFGWIELRLGNLFYNQIPNVTVSRNYIQLIYAWRSHKYISFACLVYFFGKIMHLYTKITLKKMFFEEWIWFAFISK